MPDMDSDQWLELLEAVTDDMQAAPQLGKAAASFPLAPAARGKSGKVLPRPSTRKDGVTYSRDLT